LVIHHFAKLRTNVESFSIKKWTGCYYSNYQFYQYCCHLDYLSSISLFGVFCRGVAIIFL
jgi:hypothetical protein